MVVQLLAFKVAMDVQGFTAKSGNKNSSQKIGPLGGVSI